MDEIISFFSEEMEEERKKIQEEMEREILEEEAKEFYSF